MFILRYFFVSLLLISVDSWETSQEIFEQVLNLVTLQYFKAGEVLIVNQLPLELEANRTLLPSVDKISSIFLLHSGTYKVVLLNLGIDTIQKRLHFGKFDNFLFLLNKNSDVRNLTDTLRFYNLVKQNSILLVVYLNKVSTCRVQTTLDTVWTHLKIINTGVIVLAENLTFYSNFPYSENNKAVILHFLTNATAISNTNLFPNKIPKLANEIVLKVGAFSVPPFVMESHDSDELFHGVEVLLVKTMLKKMGFMPMFIKSPPDENAKLVFNDRGAVIGLAGMLYRKDVDFAIASLPAKSEFLEVGDMLPTHTVDRLSWWTPKGPMSLDGDNLMAVFEDPVWLLTWSTLTVVALFLYCVQPRPQNIFLNVWGVLLDQGLYSVPHKTTLLFLLGIYLYFGVVITCAYRSTLFKMLTNEKEIVFLSPEDAVDSGCTTYLVPSGKGQMNLSNHAFWNKVLSPGRHYWEQSHMKIISKIIKDKPSLTLLSEKVTFYLLNRYYTDSSGKLPAVVIGKDRPLFLRVLTTTGHPLMDRFSCITLHLIEAGFIDFWYQSILHQAKQKGLKEIGISLESKLKPLTIIQLSGAFKILWIGVALGFLTFIYEAGSKYVKSRVSQGSNDSLIFLEYIE